MNFVSHESLGASQAIGTFLDVNNIFSFQPTFPSRPVTETSSMLLFGLALSLQIQAVPEFVVAAPRTSGLLGQLGH